MFINILLGDIGWLRSDILNVKTIELGNGPQRSRTWIFLQIRRALKDKEAGQGSGGGDTSRV
jgi:hypothetical protein